MPSWHPVENPTSAGFYHCRGGHAAKCKDFEPSDDIHQLGSSGNFGVNRNWNISISNSWCYRNSHKDKDIAQILAPGLQNSLSQNWQPATSSTSHFSQETQRRHGHMTPSSWNGPAEPDLRMENGNSRKKNSGCHVHEPKRLIKLNDTGQYRLIYMDDTFHFLVNIRKSNLAIWSSKDQHFIL